MKLQSFLIWLWRNVTDRRFRCTELNKAARELSFETYKLISQGSSQKLQPSIKEALQPIGHCHLQWVIVSVPHRWWCGSQGHPCVEMNVGCLTGLLWLWWAEPSSDTTTPILHAANMRLWAETNAMSCIFITLNTGTGICNHLQGIVHPKMKF